MDSIVAKVTNGINLKSFGLSIANNRPMVVEFVVEQDIKERKKTKEKTEKHWHHYLVEVAKMDKTELGVHDDYIFICTATNRGIKRFNKVRSFFHLNWLVSWATAPHSEGKLWVLEIHIDVKELVTIRSISEKTVEAVKAKEY